jgi:DNA repair protein RAD16
MAPKKSTTKQKWLTVLESDSDFEVEEVKPKPKPKPKPKTKAKAKAKEIPEEDKEGMEVTPGAPTSTEKGKKKTSIAPYMAEYILEKAKSGRAECKKCNTKIAKDELRIGVVVQGDRWITTNWQHVHCTIFPPTIQVVEALNGFCSLSTEHQNLIRERVRSSKSEVDPDDVPIDPNELVRMNWSEELEPANELLMPLLPYQKEGLGWMVNQEKSAVRGGILADEVSVLPFF